MRLAMVAFTRNGAKICERLLDGFMDQGEVCQGYIMGRVFQHGRGRLLLATDTLEEWAGRMFREQDGIIFVGAAGIAVRAIAPFLCDKMTDPAVVVVDEVGQFAISLLSGHMGGANRLARRAALILGAMPVITTATDGRGLFAVDAFAASEGYRMGSKEMAKRVSSDLLDGRLVGFFCDFPVDGGVPDGLAQDTPCGSNLWITARQGHPEGCQGRDVLRLAPPVLCIGVGCKRGMEGWRLKEAVLGVLAQAGLLPEAVGGVASVDRKADEEGIGELARGFGVGYQTFTALQLAQAPGTYEDSEFVSAVVGVGNVCERAACLLALERMEEYGMEGVMPEMPVHKQRLSGITVAVAAIPWRVRGMLGS